jgi:hypothetical protein
LLEKRNLILSGCNLRAITSRREGWQEIALARQKTAPMRERLTPMMDV